jgi:hypothetical protein
LGFALDHLVSHFGAEFVKSVDGVAQLRLYQTTHFHDFAGNVVEFVIELTGNMFIAHDE